MNFTSAKQIFDQINETKLYSLRNEVFEYCIRYARIRTDWYLMNEEERRVNEKERSGLHNVLIDSLNILSREMIRKGEDAEWRKVIGNDRKEIGDFACFVHCFTGLSMR